MKHVVLTVHFFTVSKSGINTLKKLCGFLKQSTVVSR